MTAEAVLTQVLNGLTIGAVLMLIAMGLTIIFGLMEVVNFAHGALYMLGAYLTVTVVADNRSVLALDACCAIGRGHFRSPARVDMIRPLYGRDPLRQVLLDLWSGGRPARGASRSSGDRACNYFYRLLRSRGLSSSSAYSTRRIVSPFLSQHSASPVSSGSCSDEPI